ncbi:Tolloid 2-like protein [Elysia marginata]|uniref:Tolloid 2-like protein n=1 Tax=Elysia marginata TaxID=1093978 RepID=A0AAV4JFC2_9GAST|nr:Tolloid 2-like protein [Elysia marginata]
MTTSGCQGSCDLPGYDDEAILLTDWSGTVSSPGFLSEQGYPDNQNCTWSIRVSAGSRVKVKFGVFDLEDGFYRNGQPDDWEAKQCWDNVTITDTDGQILFRSCGVLNDSTEVSSSGRSLVIQFQSDSSNGARGFNIFYYGVRCAWRIGDPAKSVRQLRMLQSTKRADDSLFSSDIDTDLPSCGDSPFMIRTSNNLSSLQDELCAGRHNLVYFESVVLVYDGTDPSTSWTGRVVINMTGLCENLPGVGESFCSCKVGYTGSDCDTSVTDACSDVTCYNGGTCQIGDQSQGFCLCPGDGDFTGQFCDIPRDARYCPAQEDVSDGYAISWGDTLAPGENVQPCPAEARGNATRLCLQHPASDTGGKWARPDLSRCVSAEVYGITQETSALLSDFLVPAEKNKKILDLTARLANVTNSFSSWRPGKPGPFPGDLLASGKVMVNLSRASGDRLKVSRSEAENLTRNYAAAVNSIIDPDMSSTWSKAPPTLVEETVSAVVGSTQAMVASVVTSLTSGPEVTSAPEVTSRRPDATEAPSGRDSEPMLNISRRNLGKAVDVYLARFQSVANLLSITEETGNSQ